jgi:cyanophycinase
VSTSFEAPHGTLVIIGGHEDKERDCVILREIAALIGNGRLVVTAVASAHPEELFQSYKQVFGRLGIGDVVELSVGKRAEGLDQARQKVLDGAAGIFFTGGDQLRITSQVGDTPMLAHINQLLEHGGVIAGTSAGASAIGEAMLVQGGNDQSHRIGNFRVAPGLGLLHGVMIDQHFAERGRIGRLLGAIALNPRLLGIGIDEDTAIIARGLGFRVIGSGAVYVVDGSRISASNIAEQEERKTLSLFDVTLHVLSTGDTFDLAKRRPAGES